MRPCGPYDRRRTGHRCMRCRLDHIACDGQRPCASCLGKHVICRSPSNSSGDMTILSYEPAKHLDAVRKPLVDSWSLYTTMFFDLVNPRTQPLIDMLSFSSIGHLFHNDESVHNAVVALGAAYASRKRIDAGPIRDSNVVSVALYTNFRSETLKQLLTANSHTSISVFLCALLLSIAEVTKLHLTIAVMFSEDVSLGDEWWHCSSRRDDDANWAELILEFAERWARLRFRSSVWLKSIAGCVTRKDHLRLGGEIIHESVILEKRIMNYVPLVMARRYGGRGSTPMSILSYYYWGLVGLSRMFIDPRWQLLQQGFNMMDEYTIHECAMAALTCVESRVASVELEAIFYAPIFKLIALETRTLEERIRVINSLRGVRSRGFPIADTIESDMRIAWSAVPGSLPS
ncbi:hypothetical protein TCE0_018f05855 [Talaromyces pinophilus]|uniref:Zn(2)-C6 fungal-type domain-containing protein n=1 Tax=Talaromyces pinophilus TaxID=128442 RepID=A0A510NWJ4_TALPI|nr:hypothetical protein TCE0_018f05855 [Talaromyces pinophilus]